MGFIKSIKDAFSSNGASAVIEGGNQILKSIDGLTTSAEEKKELRASVVNTMVTAQSAVIVAEAKAGGITAKWRPYTMLAFAGILIYSFFLGPMFGLTVVAIPPQLWSLLTLGIGGYVGGRSVEKVVETLTTAKELRKMVKLQGKLDK